MSTEKLLQKYLDRPITVDQVRGEATESFTGTLLSTQGGLILRAHARLVELHAQPGDRPQLGRADEQVDVYLEFKNAESHNMDAKRGQHSSDRHCGQVWGAAP